MIGPVISWKTTPFARDGVSISNRNSSTGSTTGTGLGRSMTWCDTVLGDILQAIAQNDAQPMLAFRRQIHSAYETEPRVPGHRVRPVFAADILAQQPEFGLPEALVVQPHLDIGDPGRADRPSIHRDIAVHG